MRAPGKCLARNFRLPLVHASLALFAACGSPSATPSPVRTSRCQLEHPVASFSTDEICIVDSTCTLRCVHHDGVLARGRVARDLPEPALDVALTEDGGCALLASGSLACWGCPLRPSRPCTEQPVVVDGIGPFTHIANSGDRLCAAEADAVRCWGPPSCRAGVETRREGTTTTMRIVGFEPDEELVLPVGATQALAVSSCTSCAVGADRRLRCWGTLAGGVERQPRVMREGVLLVSSGGREGLAILDVERRVRFLTARFAADDPWMYVGEDWSPLDVDRVDWMVGAPGDTGCVGHDRGRTLSCWNLSHAEGFVYDTRRGISVRRLDDERLRPVVIDGGVCLVDPGGVFRCPPRLMRLLEGAWPVEPLDAPSTDERQPPFTP